MPEITSFFLCENMKATFSKSEIADWNSNFAKAKRSASRNQRAMKGNSIIKSDRSFGDILTTTLSLNFVSTIVALLLEAVSNPSAPPTRIAEHMVDSFVYANCIGTLLGVSIFGFAPRLALMRFPLNWLLVMGIIFVAALFGTLAAGSILMAMGIFPPGDYSWLGIHRAGFGFLLAYVFGFSFYFYESVRLRLWTTTEQLRIKELAEEHAQKLAAEASLSSLESRIHPHFLFNTLNSISSLVQDDPPLAERMIERLAALLRFSLDSNLRNTISLEQELKIAVDYLEIEKARFGERLRYELDIPDELKRVAVPPFVVQTLVENSVKHSISLQKRGGEIRILARKYGEQIQIEVWDDGAGFSLEDIPIGRGLDNLCSRLAALFASESGLEILRENNFTIVRVSLPKLQTSEAKQYERD
jgi:two-component system, LytTR family, sensor histidine kinase AlgZ